MVCLEHGCFVAVTLYFFARGRFILGFILAMGMHYLGNLPIYLMQINLGNLGAQTWGILLAVWVPVYLLGSLFLLVYLATGKAQLGQFMFGDSVCPECQKRYPAPLFAVNLVSQRYERCPHCRHWHLVSKFVRAGETLSPPKSQNDSTGDPPATGSKN